MNPPSESLARMASSTELFLSTLANLTDDALLADSSLPGWTRRHLIAHVHYNAEGLRRLVGWAATGIERPMYASPQRRIEEIEAGSQLAPAQLRNMVASSAASLEADFGALSPDQWHAEVVTGQGRRVSATELPWLRTREVAIHAIDLDASASFTDFDTEFLSTLLADVVRKRTAAGEGPALARWLTGRTPEAPDLGPWL